MAGYESYPVGNVRKRILRNEGENGRMGELLIKFYEVRTFEHLNEECRSL
jgi:hypothetical protein